jgi:DNA-binding response OmpR family regulator
MSQRILVVEDEPGISLAVKDELEFEGFEVELATDGPSGLAAVLRSEPALIVLDLALPGLNGFQICEDLRRRGLQTPIIVLTARHEDADKIRGLALGADDYVTKPFNLAELVARIRAVLRRSRPGESADVLRVRSLRLDLRAHTAFKDDVALPLTDTEFRMLSLLLKRAGEVVTRDEFLKQVWGEDVYVTHRTVDTHIASLRRKIEDDTEHPSYILSVRAAGYRLDSTLTNS